MPEKKPGILSGGRSSVARDIEPHDSGSSSIVSGGHSSVAGEFDTYTVVKGDSLSKIAKRYYGKASRWKAIFEANRDQISDPDLIYPGQTFRIPKQ